jgi:hypothetical protein
MKMDPQFKKQLEESFENNPTSSTSDTQQQHRVATRFDASGSESGLSGKVIREPWI